MLFLNKNILVPVIVSISVLYSGSIISQSYAKTNESYNNSEVDNYWLALQISTFLYLTIIHLNHQFLENSKADQHKTPNFYYHQLKCFFCQQLKYENFKINPDVYFTINLIVNQ